MTTDDCKTFDTGEDNTQQISGIFSELKVKKSLPLVSPNINADSIDTAPRSCSANGTCSTDTPFTIGLTRETRSAFEGLSERLVTTIKPKPKTNLQLIWPIMARVINEISIKAIHVQQVPSKVIHKYTSGFDLHSARLVNLLW